LVQGRQRKTSLVVQGRFKEALPFDDVFTGQEFQEPIRDLPASWLVNVLLRIARKLSPSSIFGLLDNPHILTPVVAGAQCINISKVWDNFAYATYVEPHAGMASVCCGHMFKLCVIL
jgi:hypothetical protein